MKVCIVSRSDGRSGGFAAAYRLYQSLLQSGVDANMLVEDKQRDDSTVLSPISKIAKGWAKFVPTLDALPLSLYTQRERGSYSMQWVPDRVAAKIARIAPDVINLHWINAGYVQVETVAKFKKPIVWTLHDMWAFTGGCHYSGDCDRYIKSCGSCPQLHSSSDWDVSRLLWQRKAKAWQNLNLTVVTPSAWLAERARASSLFQDLRIEVIPNGINTQSYKPIDKKIAKDILGLPQDKQIILFGATNAASDLRKGFHLLLPALQLLQQSHGDRIEVVVFGSSQPSNPPDFGYKTHYLGKLYDDISLSLAYSAADVFVAPSIQDNLPNTVMEALACGTPCVAFKIGGMSELITHQQCGYLAQPFIVEDLSQGISWVIENIERHHKLASNARKKVEENFTFKIQSSRYLALYKQVTT